MYDLLSNDFERLSGSVWQRNFSCIELKQIMRQKEALASLLNRVRKAIHTDEDLHDLQTRVVAPTDSKLMTHYIHLQEMLMWMLTMTICYIP